MTLELTREQLQALDESGRGGLVLVDPRTLRTYRLCEQRSAAATQETSMNPDDPEDVAFREALVRHSMATVAQRLEEKS